MKVTWKVVGKARPQPVLTLCVVSAFRGGRTLVGGAKGLLPSSEAVWQHGTLPLP